jgi:hypothetical protein
LLFLLSFWETSMTVWKPKLSTQSCADSVTTFQLVSGVNLVIHSTDLPLEFILLSRAVGIKIADLCVAHSK